jgi:ribonuclease VapC
MFVDASAIVAIMTHEPDASVLAEALGEGRSAITSPIAVYEATLGICRKKRATVEAALEQVRNFMQLTGIRLVPIAPDEADGALDAFSRYGKGQGHPAQLNMGDCFAYAVAQAHHTSLLFTGNDFALTDIPAAATRTQ